jgi:hypothetical protein
LQAQAVALNIGIGLIRKTIPATISGIFANPDGLMPANLAQ